MAERVTFTKFEPFNLTGIQVSDRELGQGSYATVFELDYMGLKCAGKRIHEVLLRERDASYVTARFQEECHLLSRLRHPNIVQFLGVHFQQGDSIPILVMELLYRNLTSCIQEHGVLIDSMNYSILHDVALGLCYLHNQNPPILHRDLSSNNVLLTTNMTAKISDLGVARILNMTQLQMTRSPGCPAYMPPDVMVADQHYDVSIDQFSYGILVIHTLSGKWPEPTIGQTRTTESGKLVPVSEAERRKTYLDSIGTNHPLMDLILKCINNDPKSRACANEIVKTLTEMVNQYPRRFSDSISMFRQMSESCELESSLREIVQAKDYVIMKQCSKLDVMTKLEDELKAAYAEIKEKESQLLDREEQINETEASLQHWERKAMQYSKEIEGLYQAQLIKTEAHNLQIKQLQTQLESISKEKNDNKKQIQAITEQCNKLQAQLQENGKTHSQKVKVYEQCMEKERREFARKVTAERETCTRLLQEVKETSDYQHSQLRSEMTEIMETAEKKLTTQQEKYEKVLNEIKSENEQQQSQLRSEVVEIRKRMIEELIAKQNEHKKLIAEAKEASDHEQSKLRDKITEIKESLANAQSENEMLRTRVQILENEIAMKQETIDHRDSETKAMATSLEHYEVTIIPGLHEQLSKATKYLTRKRQVNTQLHVHTLAISLHTPLTTL